MKRFLVILMFMMVSGSLSSAGESVAPDEQFVLHVLPVLQTKCFACHGMEEGRKGGLDVRTRAAIFAGGESGEPLIIEREVDKSPLILAVRRTSERWSAMPPKENDRLTSDQLAAIEQWVRAGAPWPSDEKIASIQAAADRASAHQVFVKTSGGLSETWTNRRYPPDQLWAYRPLQVADELLARPVTEVIDELLARPLAEQGITPAPPAERRAWLRRVSYDLTGLPPSPQEMHDFLADQAHDDQACAKVVDRLLASVHYGERLAQHWLDVTRYADSAGFANDYERGSAWRYRDYVVRSFNADKPYDRFVQEQIAGDELWPDRPEAILATGFLRMGPWELTAMEVPRIARQRFLDDVTDAVGQVFLGHSLQCARCHDHKYDPVPTRDYYALQAVFATTQLAERALEFLPEENLSGREEERYLREQQEHYREQLRTLEEKRTLVAARQWLTEYDRDVAPWNDAEQTLRDQLQRTPTVAEVRQELAKRKTHPDLIPPPLVGFTPVDFGLERVARKGLERLQWRLDRYHPFACAVYSGPTLPLKVVNAPQRLPADFSRGEVETSAILAGGDPFSPRDAVTPHALSALDSLSGGSFSNIRFPTTVNGRRAALAQWLTHDDQPLTPRVMANRVWGWLFGVGLAGNPNNFGATGKRPTHPELLDYLALVLRREGWSIKSLLRHIVLSQAYRRSSSPAQEAPYASFPARRLTAEEMRDSLLLASGELNLQSGGVPCRPEMNGAVAFQPRQVMGTFAEPWQAAARPEQRHRRSLYVLRLRGLRDPFFEVFNQPSSETSCEGRGTSTIAPQAFQLLNSESSYDRSLALAHRVLKTHATPEQPLPASAIDAVFELLLQRPPNVREREVCLAHWCSMTARHRELKFTPPSYPTRLMREAVEENTGEKFTYEELLAENRDFLPDLKPHACSPETRGLAEVCLVLMNSNEFAYLD